MRVPSFESVSTWHQPLPATCSAQRQALLDDVATRIDALGKHRLRVAVDGYTASGKTSFGHELAAALRRSGRPTLRASLDDFKNPWSERHLYDRESGEGYYRNAYDFDATRRLLLEPAGRSGSGAVVLCSIDPLTQENHQDVVVRAPDDAVLVVDSVFALRPEYDDCWEFRIWLDVEPELALRRGATRDTERAGRAQAEAIHRERYHAAELIYLAEVDPVARADVVVDNRDFTRPRLLRP
jgi:uridine kinase